jgi:hypothetical protein
MQLPELGGGKTDGYAKQGSNSPDEKFCFGGEVFGRHIMEYSGV